MPTPPFGGISNPPRASPSAAYLRKAGASAAMDVSDGLSTDLGRLAAASGVAAGLDAASIPRFPEASLDQALDGGEEYELLFTAPPAVEIPVEYQGLPLRLIGAIEAGEGVYLRESGRSRELPPGGYEHLT